MRTMNTTQWQSLAAGVILLVLGGMTDAGAQTQSTKTRLTHPTRILARFRGETPAAHVQSMALSTLGVEVTRRFPLVPGLVAIDEAPQAATAHAVGALPAHSTLHARIEALRRTGLFDYVEPDFVRHPHAVPTDAAFADGRHWNLHNTGQNGGVAGMDIDAVEAWDVTTGSSEVIVAVIDSGIRATHQDLATQMWINPGEIAGNGIDDDGDGYIDDVHGIDAINGTGDTTDSMGHGTRVAGVIGAVANNDGAAVGVCWKVRLMAVNIFPGPEKEEGAGAHDSLIVGAIEYAVEHGAHIINASWGGPAYSQALADAIAAAGARGVLFVTGAGNGDPGRDTDLFPSHPASTPLPNIISAAAFIPNGELSRYSNYGAGSVHLGAPMNVFSTSSGSDDAYDYIGGTSAAAPHVSGVAALLLAQNRGYTVAQLRDRLLGSTVATEALLGTTMTGGRLSAARALTAAPDGTLELLVNPGAGGAVFAGRNATVEARVTDLDGVAGATVTGTIAGLAPLTFADDGFGSDRMAGDANYTASFAVPEGVTEIELTVEAAAAGFGSAGRTVVFSVLAPPDHDHFADRRILPSEEYVADTFSNVGASREPGEPLPAAASGATGGRSIWWSWTAPRSGRVVVTSGNEGGPDPFDTILGLYTGGALDTLVEVAANDDYDLDWGEVDQLIFGRALRNNSGVTFSAEGGVTYQIVVDGFTGDAGEGLLQVFMEQSNKTVATRKPLVGTAASVEDRVAGAYAVFYGWTAPFGALVHVLVLHQDEDGQFQEQGALPTRVFRMPHDYVGSNQDPSQSLAPNSPHGAWFPAQAGADYVIRVDWPVTPFESLTDFPTAFILELEAVPLEVTASSQEAGAGSSLTLTAPSIDELFPLPDWANTYPRWYYQWRRDGIDVPGATAPSLTIPSAQTFHAGGYSVVITVANGNLLVPSSATTSAPVAITVSSPAPSDARVTNLSTRALCRTGEEILIPGFVIQGAGTKRLLMRAVGPELAAFGVQDVLPDPTMLLKRREGGVYLDHAANDNWGENANWHDIEDTAAAIYAFPLTEGSLSAALLLDLPAGTYTILGADRAGEAGVAIVELYEIDAGEGAPTARLVNLSNRGHVGVGEDVMIPGFVVSEQGPKTFLLRAVGPGLAAHGVEGVLADPQMTVYRRDPGTGAETSILSNDNWGENGDAAEVATAAAQVYAFALADGSADAAFVVTLAPGIYTVHASGVGGTTGISLVELYEVQ